MIANHEYDKSRFLRGTAIDEGKIPDIDADEAIKDVQTVRYLHPERTAIHLLNKPISFDDTQDAVYRQPPPLLRLLPAGAVAGWGLHPLEKAPPSHGAHPLRPFTKSTCPSAMGVAADLANSPTTILIYSTSHSRLMLHVSRRYFGPPRF